MGRGNSCRGMHLMDGNSFGPSCSKQSHGRNGIQHTPTPSFYLPSLPSPSIESDWAMWKRGGAEDGIRFTINLGVFLQAELA